MTVGLVALRTWALVVAVGLAFADASVVALALPDLYTEFQTSVVGVSWVLTIYAAVVAVAGLLSMPVTARLGAGRTTALGLVLFAAASIACAGATSLAVLLVARAVQALGAAALLEGSLGVMAGGPGGAAVARRWWMAAGTFGAVLGPALGGLVTQLADWRAVFLIQAPIAAAAIPAALAANQTDLAPPRSRRRPPGALLADLGHVCTFAGLVGALFLGVLLLVVVWGLEPLEGAFVVTALPAGTLAGRALARRADAIGSVVTGAVLLAAGLLTLALLPAVSAWWVAGGLLASGLGFGALSFVLGPLAVPEGADLGPAAARSSAARHLGLVVGLLIVAPVLATGVEAGAEHATLNGTATVLDARTDLVQKVRLAWDVRSLIVSADDAEVPDLSAVFEPYGDADDVVRLERDLTETVEASITRGFRGAFAGAAGLALLAAVPGILAVRRGGGARAESDPRATTMLAVAAIAALTLLLLAWSGDAPQFGRYDPVDACAVGPDPFSGGGLDGLAQRSLLSGLNGAACELGVTREELVLSLDPDTGVADRPWDDETIERALRSGARRAIEDADDRDAIPGLAAAALRFAIDRAPLRTLIGWLTG